jgi:predicted Zn-ribbon and HTH transcriptional regulator
MGSNFADGIEQIKEHAETLDEVPMVHICLGPPRCDYNGTDDRQMPCPFCKSIRADDPRSTDEILAEMNKLQS